MPQLRDPSLLKHGVCYANGEWVTAQSGKTFNVSDPASGEIIAACPNFDEADTAAAIESAQHAFASFRSLTGRERSKLLRRWYDLAVANIEDLATLITWENGKPLAEAVGESKFATSFLEWFSEEAPRICGDTILASNSSNRISSFKEPIGVCALITPWNFPAGMVTRKAAPALSVGCTVVCKAAAETPLTSLALAELAHRAGLPKGVFNIITASADRTPEVGSVLTTHPFIKKVSFTGSTEVGKLLMQQSASTLKKLSLELEASAGRPKVSYRPGADDYVLVDYGEGVPDLNYKCRATALRRALESAPGRASANRNHGGAIFNMVGCGNSLAICYDGLSLPRKELLDRLLDIEGSIGDTRSIKIPNRQFRLPLTFRHRKLDDAMERYMANQRSIASYLPDPLAYVAENNGMTLEQLKQMFLSLESVIIGVGFFMALLGSLPADPRHRIRTPKMNPSRTYTPEGTFSVGGNVIAIYPVDCPGGFMPTGMTIPGLDIFGSKVGFSRDRPWMFEDMDTLSFYEVSEEEYDAKMAQFKSGSYQLEMREGVFDMAAHNQLLLDTAAEAQAIQEKRVAAEKGMNAREKELFAQWAAEKEAGQTSTNEIQSLLEDPEVEAIEAPVDANVWKVLVEEGDMVQAGEVMTILEAMKMEINVVVDTYLAGTTRVHKVLIKPGDGVESGSPVILLKKPQA